MSRKVFLDTDFLCSFLWIGKTNYLVKVLPEYDIMVPFQTATEIKRPLPGLKILQAKYYAAKANGDFIEAGNFEVDSEEYKEYINLTTGKDGPKAIGTGEAASIVLAKRYHGLLASNNLSDISYFVKRFGLTLVTTCDVLLALFDLFYLTEKELNKVYADMIKTGTWLPYPTFSDLLKAREEGKYIQRPIP